VGHLGSVSREKHLEEADTEHVGSGAEVRGRRWSRSCLLSAIAIHVTRVARSAEPAGRGSGRRFPPE
jgi:hypothetical protein